MPSAAPFLMFQGQCEAALTHYVAAIPGAEIRELRRYGAGEPGIEGTVAMATLVVGGLAIMANDSPPVHAFTFTPSTSIFLTVDDEEQFDAIAAALPANGGSWMMPPGAYGFSRKFGWCADRFGVSWQINLP